MLSYLLSAHTAHGHERLQLRWKRHFLSSKSPPGPINLKNISWITKTTPLHTQWAAFQAHKYFQAQQNALFQSGQVLLSGFGASVQLILYGFSPEMSSKMKFRRVCSVWKHPNNTFCKETPYSLFFFEGEGGVVCFYYIKFFHQHILWGRNH